MMSRYKIELICLAVLVTIGASLFSNSLARQHDDASLARHSVMISSPHGGGSGVIIRSSIGGSVILTNAHVCALLENGDGLVQTHLGNLYYPTGYSLSTLHDLCLVKVSENLGVNTVIAESGDKILTLTKTVGHPKLLPTTISSGHLAGRTQIQVMTHLIPCTDADKQNEQTSLMCMFTGGIPVIKTYTADIHTFLISGGSSGSPVYNSNDEIVGLVFAGTDRMSEAYVVPVEAINKTLSDSKYVTIGKIKTSRTYVEILQGGRSRHINNDSMYRLRVACNSITTREKLGNVCRFVDRNMLFYNDEQTN